LVSFQLVIFPLFLLAVCCAEDDAGGSDREEGAVFDDTALTVAQDFVIYEGAGIARAIAEYIFQSSFLVTAYIDDAVVHIYTWIYSLDRAVDATVLHISSDDVVAHLQRDNLLVGEYVFDDYDGAYAILIGVFVNLLFLAGFAEFGNAHADAKLLVAIRANEDQALTCLVFGLVERDEIIAFRATYSFHIYFFSFLDFFLYIIMYKRINLLL